MPLYRVDKRHFNNDEIITPQTTFEGVMNDLQLEVEMSLNNLRPPSVPIRKECLYLFCNLSSALTFCLQAFGQKYISPTKAAIIFSLESVIATIAAAIFYEEVITWNVIVGGLLMLAATIIVQIKFRKTTAK